MSNFESNKYKFVTNTNTNLVEAGVEEKRKEEIEIILGELNDYGILIKDLVSKSPSLKERNKILNIALYIFNNEELYSFFLKRKKLPLSIVSKKINQEKSFLDKWKDYLIFYLIIVSLEDIRYFAEYVKYDENVNVIGTDEVDDKSKIFKGLVLSINRSTAIIATNLGLVKKITLNSNANVGSEIQGKENFNLRNIKIVGICIVILATFIGGIFTYKYNNINKVVLIETTSNIKLEVNDFNRVINISSSTEKGKELIQELLLKDKEIDYSIYRILEYAHKDKLIPEEGIMITVSGEPVEYGTLKKTSDYILEKSIIVNFNNAGTEQTLTIYK